MSRMFPFARGAFRTTRQTRATAVIDLDCTAQTTGSSYVNVVFSGAVTNHSFTWPGGRCLWMLSCQSSSNLANANIEYQVIRNSDSSVLAGDVGGSSKWICLHSVANEENHHTFFDVQAPPKGVYDINLQFRNTLGAGLIGHAVHRILLVALPAE